MEELEEKKNEKINEENKLKELKDIIVVPPNKDINNQKPSEIQTEEIKENEKINEESKLKQLKDINVVPQNKDINNQKPNEMHTEEKKNRMKIYVLH